VELVKRQRQLPVKTALVKGHVHMHVRVLRTDMRIAHVDARYILARDFRISYGLSPFIRISSLPIAGLEAVFKVKGS